MIQTVLLYKDLSVTDPTLGTGAGLLLLTLPVVTIEAEQDCTKLLSHKGGVVKRTCFQFI